MKTRGKYKIPRDFDVVPLATHLEWSRSADEVHKVVRRREGMSASEPETPSNTNGRRLHAWKMSSEHPLLRKLGFRGDFPGAFVYCPVLQTVCWADHCRDAWKMFREVECILRERTPCFIAK